MVPALYVLWYPKRQQLCSKNRYTLILPAKFLEKYVGKSKEQNAGKIGGSWKNGYQGMET